MPTRNVNLTEHFDKFIEQRIKGGRFTNASEVVREALRIMEERDKERDQKMKALKAALQVGIDELDRGEGIVLKDEEELEAFMKEVAESARKKLKSKKNA